VQQYSLCHVYSLSILALSRALTTSFGSICFGSLLVALIQALRSLANEAQQNGDSGILGCIAECILACLQSIVEYFNKWAFIYVGLYGYSYLEAGKNVFVLFKNRGWDAIVADDLIGNVLFLVSLLVGVLTGVAGIVLQSTSDLMDSAPGDKVLISFLYVHICIDFWYTFLFLTSHASRLGFIVGIVLCSIFVGSIGSAVNAVIVLFAEAPAEFEQNHPELSSQMRAAWADAFPGSV
jgi:Plasma-membrane choline transporter